MNLSQFNLKIARPLQGIKALAIFMAWLGLGLFACCRVITDTGLTYLTSASVPGSVYRNSSESLHRGGYVRFCPDLTTPALRALLSRGSVSSGSCGATQPFIKKVAALPGDVVELSQSGVRINGKDVSATEVLPTDSLGREMPHYLFGRYVMRPDQAWLVSNYHPRSFDSRYYGPVSIRSLTAVTELF